MRWIFLLDLFLAFAVFCNTANALTLTSTVITNQSTIPTTYSCDGKNVSPPLKWSNVPDKTASFALILSDPDAPKGMFYHWVIFNIPPHIKQLLEDAANIPAETIIAKNSWGNHEYGGPCPPKGTTHRYQFKLYALDTMLTLDTNADAQSVMAAMQNHILATATLTATFKH